MRIHPHSFAFSVLLGLLSSLPIFGFDMVLPSLSATAADLGVVPADASLAMSIYLVTPGAALLVYGPLSDRFGRKPIVVFGCVLLIVASLGCALCRSLPQFLLFRALQGTGASATGIAAIAIVRDLFDGRAAQAKMCNVVFSINVVRTIGPTIGAALLSLGGWRIVYLVPVTGALLLLISMLGFSESAKSDRDMPLSVAAVTKDYLRVLRHPVCAGNILCNAAAAGMSYAYITGSSLFFVDAIGLSPYQYGVIFGAISSSVMVGALISRRLNAWGLSSGQITAIGLVLSTALATLLLLMAIEGSRSIAVAVLVMVGVALSFGLISPNAMNGALKPMPEIAGSAIAVMTFIQMVVSALSSALVALLFDGHSAFSMAVVMFSFCLLANVFYVGLVRRSTFRCVDMRRLEDQSWVQRLLHQTKGQVHVPEGRSRTR